MRQHIYGSGGQPHNPGEEDEEEGNAPPHPLPSPSTPVLCLPAPLCLSRPPTLPLPSDLSEPLPVRCAAFLLRPSPSPLALSPQPLALSMQKCFHPAVFTFVPRFPRITHLLLLLVFFFVPGPLNRAFDAALFRPVGLASELKKFQKSEARARRKTRGTKGHAATGKRGDSGARGRRGGRRGRGEASSGGRGGLAEGEEPRVQTPGPLSYWLQALCIVFALSLASSLPPQPSSQQITPFHPPYLYPPPLYNRVHPSLLRPLCFGGSNSLLFSYLTSHR